MILIEPEDVGFMESLISQFKEKNLKFDVRDKKEVKVKQTPLERKRKRKAYRKMYSEREDVKRRRLERSKRPEVIERRNAYGKDPYIKTRKSELQKVRRRTLKEIEDKYPEIYEQCRGLTVKTMIDKGILTATKKPSQLKKEKKEDKEEKEKTEKEEKDQDQDQDQDQKESLKTKRKHLFLRRTKATVSLLSK